MCGRFALFRKKEEILEQLELSFWDQPDGHEPAYNIAPTATVPVVVQRATTRGMTPMRWGLTPGWAKGADMGARMINARSETVDVKPSFRQLIGRQHCVAAMDAYFEWQRCGRDKTPFMISDPAGKLLLAAGLWDSWKPPNGEPMHTFTILTREPTKQLAKVHDRMPFLLGFEQLDSWLGGSDAALRAPLNIHEMAMARISSRINSVTNTGPDVIEVIPDQLELGI